jgi:hypothetical protein
VPVVQRGSKRCRHPELPHAAPAATTDSPSESISAEQPTTQRDGASLSQLCSRSSPVLVSAATKCLHRASPQTCAVTASGPESFQRHSLPSCVTCRYDAQSAPPTARRSTRQ